MAAKGLAVNEAREVRFARGAGGRQIAFAERDAGELIVVPPYLPGAILDAEEDQGFWHLADKARVVSYDAAGFGRSARGEGGHSLEELAADLEGVIAAAGRAPAVLLGLAFAGPASIKLAAEVPQLVKQLLLLDTWAGGPVFDDGEFALFEEAVEADRWADSRDAQVSSRGIVRSFYTRRPIGVLEAAFALSEAEIAEARSLFRAADREDVRPLLAGIAGPAVVFSRYRHAGAIDASEELARGLRAPLVQVKFNARTQDLVDEARRLELAERDGYRWLSFDSGRLEEEFGLSRRECDLLPYVAAGRAYPQVAYHRLISVVTARAHFDHMAAKLGLATHDELAAWARARGRAAA